MSKQVYNILVTNIDQNVSVEALTTFFSFTGNVIEVRLSDAEDGTKKAIVSFDNEESVKTAELMTGATLEGRRINIEPTDMTQQENEQIYTGETLPQRTIPELPEQHTKTSVAASLLAQGYILASDTFQKAVEFDKQHSITASIKAGAQKVKEKAIEVDEKLHITEYLALGVAYAKSVVTGIDDKYQISSTVSSAVSTATQKVDETLHITEGVQTAKGAIERGVDRVMNSQPIVSMKQSTNNFKESIKQEINSRRPNEMKEATEDVPPADEPFEVVDDNIEVSLQPIEESQPIVPPSETTEQPTDQQDTIIIVDDNDTPIQPSN